MSKRLRCKDCENSEKYSCEEPCSTCYGYENFKEKKSMSNGDRIREMSDEELAEILISSEDNYMFFTTDGEEFRNFKDGLEHQLEWLKSPIE